MTDLDRNPDAIHQLRERVVVLEAELARVRRHRADLYVLVERIQSLTHRSLTNPYPPETP